MKKIVINGGRPLKGEITISGAKNSVVALIPAIILSDDVVILTVFQTSLTLLVWLISWKLWVLV